MADLGTNNTAVAAVNPDDYFNYRDFADDGTEVAHFNDHAVSTFFATCDRTELMDNYSQNVTLQPRMKEDFLDVLGSIPEGKRLQLQSVISAPGEPFTVAEYKEIASKCPSTYVRMVKVDSDEDMQDVISLNKWVAYASGLQISGTAIKAETFAAYSHNPEYIDLSANQEAAEAFFANYDNRICVMSELSLSGLTLKQEWFTEEGNFWHDLGGLDLTHCPDVIEFLKALKKDMPAFIFDCLNSLKLSIELSYADRDFLQTVMPRLHPANIAFVPTLTKAARKA
jgi:hypothetical protein